MDGHDQPAIAVMPPRTERSVSPAGRTDENIYLFVPNLIGYSRIVLAAISLSYMDYHPKYCTVAYSLSCLLDAVDGVAARALGQTSKLGAVLDMVTDRCTTSCLLTFLASAWPRYALVFQFLITLDFSSHYIHMYASAMSGSQSHKKITKEQSWILWSYYNNSKVLFFFCAGNELFFVALYLMAFVKTPLGLAGLLKTVPSGVLEQVPFPLLKAVEQLTWPMIMALVSFPVCAVKQFINFVQIYKAASSLVDSDRRERWEAQQLRAR